MLATRTEGQSIQPNWEIQSRKCLRDLIIKKVCMTILFALNVGAIGTALYFIISYAPIPTQAFIISPYIIGVIGAIYFLKMPHFGLTKFNYTHITNPAVQVGKVVALIFFGPYVLISNKVDETPYHLPHVANAISHKLGKESFEKLNTDHGAHFENLHKYGFIDAETLNELNTLRVRLHPVEWEIKYIQKQYHPPAEAPKSTDTEEKEKEKEGEGIVNSSHNRLGELNAAKQAIENEWNCFRQQKLATFPNAPVTNIHGDSRWNRIWLTVQDFFLDPERYIPEDSQKAYLISA